MRIAVLAFSGIVLASSAFAQQMPSPAELGNKLVKEVCAEGQFYQLTRDEAQVFNNYYVYGMMQMDAQSERWFYSDQPGQKTPYCLERYTATSPAKCRAGDVGVASDSPTRVMLAMNQIYHPNHLKAQDCW
ncbi:hypothetical protein STVA_20030 [Allostella vacuolata]|nr:hypothetical protein STVA_20030 [Stella vacuolata]